MSRGNKRCMWNVFFWLTGFAAFIIAVGSFAPVQSAPTAAGISVLDALHVLAYFVLATLIYLYLEKSGGKPVQAVVLAVVYGAAIEAVQFFIPFRLFSFMDVALNTVGAGFLLVSLKLGVFDWCSHHAQRLFKN